MARCGCVEKCSCVFMDGNCAVVEITATGGSGCGVSPTLSYAVNVKTDNQTVFCGAGGLNSVLTHIDTNTIDLEGLGTAGSPLEAHVIRTPDANVPENLGFGNLIKELPGAGGGIYVDCEDIQDCVGAAIDVATADCLEYNDAANTIGIMICAEPNGLECAPAGSPGCPTGGLLVTPSSDANNSLVFGTDGRLYAPAAAVAPGDCMTFSGSGTQADPFVITPLIAPEQNGIECVPGSGLLVTPSSDAGNRLVFGGDQRLYANACPLVQGGSQVLTGNAGPCFELTGGDCGVPMVATLRISDDVCQGLQCRADGLFVQVDQTEVPQATELNIPFGPFGPFNGNTAVGNPTILIQPICINVVNPSPCRDMVTKGVMTGFADTGRTNGRFRLAFEISAGGIGGPWFSVSQMGQSSPQPASRQTGNAIWSGNEVTIGPGGNRTLCFRLQYNSQDPGRPAVNANIFSGEVNLSIVSRWAQ